MSMSLRFFCSEEDGCVWGGGCQYGSNEKKTHVSLLLQSLLAVLTTPLGVDVDIITVVSVAVLGNHRATIQKWRDLCV